MLQINNLTVIYGNIRAVNSVDLIVKEKEIVALVGANGAGKTTLLKTISGLLKPSSGNIFFRGVEITNLSPVEIIKKGIVHIPEGRRIFPELTVRENLVMGAYSLNKNLKEINKKIEEVLSLFPELQGRETQLGNQLSGGEQQMLAIARGLMSEPKLILLDEPTMGLAPIVLERLANIIISLKKNGVSILLAEQNLYFSFEVAERAYIIETGRITLEGNPKDMKQDSKIMHAYFGENY
ncbi:MAG: ABC transporter ATP-binding protein [Dictyoglomaceae bacterium]